MKYVIEKSQNKIMSYLLGDDGRAVEIHADRLQDGLKLGDIVIGRVERVAANTQACFVEVEHGVKGYLPFDEMADPLYTRKGASPRVQQGDELVVQVSREAFGSKGMSLTTKLQLGGRYLVLQKCGTGLGISRKISPKRRDYLRENLFSQDMLEKVRQMLGTCGIIVRTNAEGPLCEEDRGKTRGGEASSASCGEREKIDDRMRRELKELASAMQHILLTAPYRPAFTVMFRQPDRWLKRTDSLPVGNMEAVLTDDRDLYDKLSDYLTPPLSDMLRFYQDDMVSLHSVFSLTRELGRALSRKVNMKSGANLVIEQTEALVSIDVNSSHSIREKDKEKAALKINLEAAEECARQIRLRNLSGMILIDFINMEEEESYDQLMQKLRQATFADPMRVQVVDRTGLGLVEMTRRKVEAPLYRALMPLGEEN